MVVSNVAHRFVALCDSYLTVVNFDGAYCGFVGMSCWSNDDELHLVLIDVEYVPSHPDADVIEVGVHLYNGFLLLIHVKR